MKTTDPKPLLTILLLACTPLAGADEGGVYTVHDANGDGYLDREEYRHYLENRRIKPAYRHLWAFDKVDTDGDGRISNTEMVETLQKEMALRAQRRKSR